METPKRAIPSKLTIIGGGITGLAAAYLAAKAGVQVTVLESGKQFGGLLNTFSVGGNRLEFFYHHFFTHDAELRWLLQELGMEHELAFYPSTMGVFRDGRAYDFNSPIDLLRFKPIEWLDKIRFGLSSLYMGKFADWRAYEGVSAIEWLGKYAGRTAVDSLWRPMLDIKFGPYADHVPLSWMIGRMRQRLGSRKKGDEQLGYLKGSLSSLLDRLLDKLKEMGVALQAESPVLRVLPGVGQKLQGVVTPTQEYLGGDFLFTIPTVYLSPLIRDSFPALATQLDRVQYFGAVCTVLALDRPLSPIYWLNVADPGFTFGGIIEHTNLVPAAHYQGLHLVYLSRYFSWQEPLAQMSQQEIATAMIAQLPRIYPAFDQQWIKERHVFKSMTAATVCDLFFSKKVQPYRTSIDHLYLASMQHIYPDERSVNNSIRVAASALASMGIATDYVPTAHSLSGRLGADF